MLIWKTTLKTLRKKEKKKKKREKKKKTRLMEESSICTALHGLYIKQFYIQFHPFYITKRINNTINGIFCHRVTVWNRYMWYYCLYNSDWENNATYSYLLYNDTLYFQLLKLHVHPQYKQTSTCSAFSLSLRIDVMSLQRIYFRRLNSELSCKHDNYETLICHISSKLCMTIMYLASIQFIALSNKK